MKSNLHGLGGNSTMYSMVLVASLATAGDAPEFGKKSNGGAGCTGAVVAAPAGCSGVVVDAGGCTGGGRRGLLGRHKDKGNGCSGGGVSAGCTGVVDAGGCSGGGRQGLFSRLGNHKNKGNGCSGVTVVAAPCGCCGTAPAAVAMPAAGGMPMPMDKKTDAKTGKE